MLGRVDLSTTWGNRCLVGLRFPTLQDIWAIKTLVGWLVKGIRLYIQLYKYYSKPLLVIPINQPVNPGMSPGFFCSTAHLCCRNVECFSGDLSEVWHRRRWNHQPNAFGGDLEKLCKKKRQNGLIFSHPPRVAVWTLRGLLKKQPFKSIHLEGPFGICFIQHDTSFTSWYSGVEAKFVWGLLY